MSETTITSTSISRTGITPTQAAANADGSKWLNTGREFLHIKNTDGSPVTATIDSRVGCDQEGTDHNIAVVIPATTGDKMIGPFPKGRFNDSSGYAHVSFTDVTALTIQLIKLPLV